MTTATNNTARRYNVNAAAFAPFIEREKNWADNSVGMTAVGARRAQQAWQRCAGLSLALRWLPKQTAKTLAVNLAFLTEFISEQEDVMTQVAAQRGLTLDVYIKEELPKSRNHFVAYRKLVAMRDAYRKAFLLAATRLSDGLTGNDLQDWVKEHAAEFAR